MTVIILSILILLMMLFVQDMHSRSVYWFIFPFLAFLYIMTHVLVGQGIMQWLPGVGKNIIFLVLQFVFVGIYFSVKARRPVNILNGMISWGDILFLITLTFYFSFLNYVLFYLGSIVLVAVAALVRNSFASDKRIPLAGWQALIFAVFLACNDLFFHWDVLNNNGLLSYLMPWT